MYISRLVGWVVGGEGGMCVYVCVCVRVCMYVCVKKEFKQNTGWTTPKLPSKTWPVTPVASQFSRKPYNT